MRAVIASMKELPAEKAKILVVEGHRSSPTGGWACSTTISRVGSRSSSRRSGRAQPLGPERLRRRSAVLGLRGPGADHLPLLHHRGAARRPARRALTGGSRSMSSTSTSGRNVRGVGLGRAGGRPGTGHPPGPLGRRGVGAAASDPLRRDPASVHLATVETATAARGIPTARVMPSPTPGSPTAGSTHSSLIRQSIRRCAGEPTAPHLCGTSSSCSPGPPRPPSGSASTALPARGGPRQGSRPEGREPRPGQPGDGRTQRGYEGLIRTVRVRQDRPVRR